VRSNVLASLAVTRDNIKNTRGETNLLGKLSSVKRREGSGLGRFQDNSVTSGECGANLPRKHEQRKVPGNDLTTDTNGLSANVIKVARTRVNNVTIDLVGPAAVVSDTVCRELDINSGKGKRLTIVEGLDRSKGLSMLLNLVSEVVKESTSVRRVTKTPVIKGSLGGLNGKLNIGLASFVNFSNLLFSGRVFNGEFLAILRLDKLVVNEKTSRLLVGFAVGKSDGFDSRHYDIYVREKMIDEEMERKKILN
jgi:hypothetical protein